MFPNVRLMAASTLLSVIALFFAFGVYASLRVSHEPLARPSRGAPLQLVGLNVAMLPVAVLEPFVSQHSGPVAAGNSSVLAYSGTQGSEPQAAPPVADAANVHEDNAEATEPAENSAVTQIQIQDSAGLESARDTKSPDEAMQESASPVETLPPSVTEPAPPVSLPAASAPLQTSPAERTAVIETMPATVASDPALDAEIPAKEKKKPVVKHHLYRVQPRAVAQTSPPQAVSYPAAIGGPFVSPPKH